MTQPTSVARSAEPVASSALLQTMRRELPYPSPLRGWTVVGLLLLAYSISLVDRQILSLLVEPVKHDLGVTDTELSLLVGFAFVIFYSTLGLFFGRLADRSNRRNMVVGGMLLWSAATIGCGFAENFQELFVARMLVGVGEATLTPAAYSLIADYFPKERRSKAVSVYTMGVCLGLGAAFMFGGAVVAATSGSATVVVPLVGAVRSWQAAFIVVGVPGVVVAALMLLVREPVRHEVAAVRSSLGDLVAFFRSNRELLFCLILSFGLNGMINGCLTAWIPTVFIRTFGWTPGQIGAAFGLIELTAGPAGVLAGGWWVARRNARDKGTIVFRTFRAAFFAMPPCILLIGLSGSAVVALAALCVMAFAIGICFTLVPVAVYEVAPNQFRAQLISIYLVVSTLMAFAIGVTLIAAATDYVFREPKAVGKSMALVLGALPFLGAYCLHRVVALRSASSIPIEP